MELDRIAIENIAIRRKAADLLRREGVYRVVITVLSNLW